MTKEPNPSSPGKSATHLYSPDLGTSIKPNSNKPQGEHEFPPQRQDRKQTVRLSLHRGKPLPTGILQYCCQEQNEIFQFKRFLLIAVFSLKLLGLTAFFIAMYLLTLDYTFLSLNDKLVRQGSDALGFHDNNAQKKFIPLHHHRALWKSFPSNPIGIWRHRPSPWPFTETQENTHMMLKNRSSCLA